MGATQPDPMWPALSASLITIVVGALASYFKPFIESQAEFRQRVRLRREALLEQLSSRHAALLQHLRRLITAEVAVLRGDRREEPDLVGEFTSETFRLFTVFHRLETLRLSVRAAFTGLLITVCLGLFGALASWLWVDVRSWILTGSIVLVVLQIGLIVILYWASWKLETYEDVT